LAKHTFGQPRALASELASVLPSAVVGCLDLDGLEIVPGSFSDADLRASHSDILARVPAASTGEVFVYVVFEHQSTPDPSMPWRMYCYLAQVWTRLKRDDPSPGSPVVIPIVLHHGPSGDAV